MLIPDRCRSFLELLSDLLPLLFQVCYVLMLFSKFLFGIDILCLPVFDLLEYDGVSLLLADVVLLVLVAAQVLLLML